MEYIITTRSIDTPRDFDLRHRGEHSTTCKNKNPQATLSHSFDKRPKFIQDIVYRSQQTNILTSDVVMFQSKILGRQRRYYEDGSKAMRALFTVFCEHLNLVTWQIEISLVNAAYKAGLVTMSASERLRKKQSDKAIEQAKETGEYLEPYKPRVSMSRATRAFQKLVNLGLIKAPYEWQVWDDKYRGGWLDKVYEATDLFFAALRLTNDRVESARARQLAFAKHEAALHGMTPEEVGKLSIAQIRTIRRQRWRKLAFERRATEQHRKKVARELNDKGQQEQRSVATKNVLDRLSVNELKEFTADSFKAAVDHEIASLRKFAKQRYN